MAETWHHKIIQKIALVSFNNGVKEKHIAFVQAFMLLFILVEIYNILNSYLTNTVEPALITVISVLIVLQITIISFLQMFKPHLKATYDSGVKLSTDGKNKLKTKLGRYGKIAVACYAVYVGLAIIIGGIESVIIVEGGAKETVGYSDIYLVFGYPVIAIVLWPIFSKKLQ